MLELVSADRADIQFVKVDVFDNGLYASELSVGQIPTMVLFQNGKELKRHTGSMASHDLKEWLGT